MEEPPIFIIILLAVLVSLVLSFIYFGGTLLILLSSWVPMKTRLRWMAFSATPLSLLVAIAAAIIGNLPTGTAAGERYGDAFTPVGLMAGLIGVAVVAANWVIFRKFRAAFPRASKPGRLAEMR